MNIFSLINRLNRRYLSGLTVKLSPFGLTPANWSLLDYLVQNGQVTSIQIATYWDIEKPTVSANVKQLIKLGLIETIPGKDKREKQLILTEKGHLLMNEVSPIISKFQDDFLSNFQKEEKEFLQRGLSTLYEAMKE
ncbi:MarR family transcriptional regulator [Virgibacillus sp. 6R]|uniref:MarR family winged helix-turn-helix transcriptional regulator n=1 Tax=Metabacillus sp. 22489 TaxID=3453928 RepID=UPI0016434F8D